MSEFTCKQGHLIRPSVGCCEICGGKAIRMDGMSNNELEARDRDYARELEEEEKASYKEEENE